MSILSRVLLDDVSVVDEGCTEAGGLSVSFGERGREDRAVGRRSRSRVDGGTLSLVERGKEVLVLNLVGRVPLLDPVVCRVRRE